MPSCTISSCYTVRSDKIHYVNSVNDRGEGATLIMCLAAATEEVMESAMVLRKAFIYYPSLVLAFLLSFFLLTISALGNL